MRACGHETGRLTERPNISESYVLRAALLRHSASERCRTMGGFLGGSRCKVRGQLAGPSPGVLGQSVPRRANIGVSCPGLPRPVGQRQGGRSPERPQKRCSRGDGVRICQSRLFRDL